MLDSLRVTPERLEQMESVLKERFRNNRKREPHWLDADVRDLLHDLRVLREEDERCNESWAKAVRIMDKLREQRDRYEAALRKIEDADWGDAGRMQALASEALDKKENL